MGQYKDKVKKHFWMMYCENIGSVGSAEEFKKKYDPIFKIKSKEAVELAENHLWAAIYSTIKEKRDPDDLKRELEKVVSIDSGKIRDNIWQLLLFFFSDNRGKEAFQENFEPVLRIDTKEALPLIEGHLWKKFYQLSKQMKDPDKLGNELEKVLKVDIKKAAEAIKEINPEKYEFLQIYK